MLKLNKFELLSRRGLFPADKKYYTDGLHVTVEGSRLKAKLFADYIVENKLIPELQ